MTKCKEPLLAQLVASSAYIVAVREGLGSYVEFCSDVVVVIHCPNTLQDETALRAHSQLHVQHQVHQYSDIKLEAGAMMRPGLLEVIER